MRSPVHFVVAAAAFASIGAAVPGAAAVPTGAAPPRGQCALPVYGPGDRYHPHIDPSRFSAHVTNPLFPLTPGTTYVYGGSEDAHTMVDVFAPSADTFVVDGVRARVVHDEVIRDGVLHERTTDYYAQDDCGNVWYFGEDTATLDRDGNIVSQAGTWHAGVDGAQPGVFMQAQPQLGRKFRQEWSAGIAEDSYFAVARGVTVKVPYGTFRNALRTTETTALEPGVRDEKQYVPGVGEVLERTVRGGNEQFVLVSVTH
jgi:hypothetical protein